MGPLVVLLIAIFSIVILPAVVMIGYVKIATGNWIWQLRVSDGRSGR